ncbi:hypothetical protein COD74_06135 [Bacillus cereus]|uniref:hypothetical protein n=1 Tax=Bacillus cereus TaxID=1396 RepID=UPI000BF743F6|nr:hypothetical protein [Bacillus cereus]PFD77536.1 hypothetical protein CN301_03450 [Bacillus cereus]PGV46549.1 hypothetical protein COD74_06135 [Bacillus cereus]
MCQFCSNQKNFEQPKFKLFNIDPIPFYTPPRSQQNYTASSEPTVTSPRSQQNYTASSESTVTSPRSQQNYTASSESTVTPPRSQQNYTASSEPTVTSSRSQKISIVLLNLPSPSVSQGESKRFKIKQNNSQSISKYQINASKDITNEIQKLLRDYQLIHLPIIIFLEQIHIKGFIMSIGKESIAVTGPYLQVKDNSTNKIIQSPNKITIKIKSIQAISNAKNFLIKNNADQTN